MKGLQKVTDFRYKLLEKEDELFLIGALKDSLGSYMAAKGLKNVTPESIAYAIEEAEKVTFRNNNNAQYAFHA